jgi:hypothetical protein
MLKLSKYLAIAIVTIMVALIATPLMENVTAVPAGWNEHKLSGDISPQMSSTAVDVNGKVHILVIDYNNGAHLVYTDDVSGSWAAPYTIDVCAGTTPVIATDSNGHSHIVYLQQNNSLMYATNNAGSWVNTTIFTNPSGPAYDISMAVDHNDKVHIAFSAYLSNLVRHATNAGGSWAIENVTQGSNVESVPALAIDSNNKVHIACLSYGTYDGIVYHENTTGTWTTSFVYPTFAVDFISMRLDHNDKAHIGFMTASETVRYATNAAGSWQNTTIGKVGMVDSNIESVSPLTLVVDSSDNPSICYCNTTGDFDYFVEVASKSGNAWTITRLQSGLAQSMAISQTDQKYVTYEGWGNISGFMLDSTGTITPGTLGGSSGSPPGPVTSVTSTEGDSKVTIKWSAPTTGGISTSTKIYRSTTNSTPTSPLTTVGAASGQYVDSTVVNNQTYYYWLVSSNSYGNGPAVATGGVTPAETNSSPDSDGNGGFLILLILLILIIVVVVVVIRRKRKKGSNPP